MILSLRQKLLAVLFLFIFIAAVSSLLIVNYFEKSKDSLTEVVLRINAIDKLLLEDVNVTHQFFETETTNPLFFRTGRSKILDVHENICVAIEKDILQLEEYQQKKGFNLEGDIAEAKKSYTYYQNRMNTMVSLITSRGYKDYGIEGKMRKFAHALENYGNEIGMINVLSLRRHEKDFIIRQEDQYLTLHNQLISSITNELYSKDESIMPKKAEILSLLNNYSKYFNILVSFEKRIGLRNQKGLKESVEKSAQKVHAVLTGLNHAASQKEHEGLFRIKLIFAGIWLLAMAITVILALVISKRATLSIVTLNNKINEFVNGDFTKTKRKIYSENVSKSTHLITKI